MRRPNFSSSISACATSMSCPTRRNCERAICRQPLSPRPPRRPNRRRWPRPRRARLLRPRNSLGPVGKQTRQEIDQPECGNRLPLPMKRFALAGGRILALLPLIFGLSGCGYNRLVALEQNVNKKWADVQSVYQRRADLIPNLVQTVAGAANFEKSTLTEITNARASVGQVRIDPNKAPTDPAQLEQFQAAQTQLSNALSRLLVVVERYPELRANQNFLSLQAQLEGTENRISVERNNFNGAVQAYNTTVRSFPTNLIAGMFGFAPRPFFNAQPGAEKAPAVNFIFGTPAPAATATA